MSSSTKQPYIARGKEAQSIWLLRDHVTPLIGPQHTNGHFAMAISGCHPGDGPPPHIHRREDEAFYILEGEMTFLYGDQLLRAAPGTFVWGPRDIVHRFQCTSKTPAKMVLMVSPTQFLDFAMTLAEPAVDFMSPPELSPAKIGQLMQVAPQYGIEMKLDHALPLVVSDAKQARKRVWAMGEKVSYLATADDTNGAFTFCEIATRPDGGPPPHKHAVMDEIFYVIEGRHDFLVGDKTETLEAGDALYIPAGTMHTFSNKSAATGRLLDIHTPGGFEKFFDEIGADCEQHPEPPPPPTLTREQIADLFARHGMTM
jgi:quercetin dioxygenase-like cupin family protein